MTMETRKLLNDLTLEQKKKLLLFLMSLPSNRDKLSEIEKKYNIKLVGVIQ